MQLTLSPEIEEYIRDQVQSGKFSSADELIVQAIQSMMIGEVNDAELDPDTAAAIQRAEQQYQRGEGVDFDVVAAQWRNRIRQDRQ